MYVNILLGTEKTCMQIFTFLSCASYTFQELDYSVISFFIFYVFFLHKVTGMIFKRALAIEEILLN